jgi:DNA (cytosine-5)-methyltransferase 1
MLQSSAMRDESRRTQLKVSALFAGIGGVELGLGRNGHETVLLCEWDPAAQSVLRHQFESIPLVGDVRELQLLPKETDLLTAGFPCQDLSQAGRTVGITGGRSGLVEEVFRLLEESRTPHVLLENVPFMLQLDKGAAMRHITARLERLGYSWAYRVVDSRAFGLPQRRQRVFLLASLEMKPEELLFQEDAGDFEPSDHRGRACGFYWTEGVRGLGWAIDAVPTLKGGSTIGIPSPPAIWFPDGLIATPDIRDAERLQGFPTDWTLPAATAVNRNARWKLVGNAVTVNAAEWIGSCLTRQPRPLNLIPLPFDAFRSWPKAAYGSFGNGMFEVPVSMFPIRKKRPSLERFLKFKPSPLSLRAVSGFTSRLTTGGLNFPNEFLDDLLKHKQRMSVSGEVVPAK